MQKTKKKWYKQWWVYVIAVVVAYVVFSLIPTKVSKKTDLDPNQDMSARTVTLEKGSLEKTVTANGSIASQHSVSVIAPNPNKIEEVFVAVGDTVHVGDRLVQLDASYLQKEYARMSKSMGKSQEQLDQEAQNALDAKNWAWSQKPKRGAGESEEDFKKRDELWGHEFASVNGAYFEAVKAAQEGPDGERDRLSDKYDEIEKCTLKAEQDGTITFLNASVGSKPEGIVARIDDVTSLQVTVYVDEWDILSIQKGMKAVVKVDAADARIPATVEAVALSKEGDKGFPVVVSLNETNPKLLIGMNCVVRIVTSEEENVFKVPMDAVGKNEDGKSCVYVKKDDGFESVVVETGMNNGWDVVISGAGIESGVEVRASYEVVPKDPENVDLVIGG